MPLDQDLTQLEAKLQLHRTALLVTLAVAILTLVGIFVKWHEDDKHRDEQLKVLHDSVTKDSLARVAAVQKTDSVVKISDSLTKQSRVTTVVYRSHTDSILVYLDRILHDTVTDSVKIVRLVEQSKVDKQVSDKTVNQCTEALNSCELAKLQFAGERLAWAKERSDLGKTLAKSEAQHHHWGLGSTCGLAVVKAGSDVKGGPGCTVGITYRW